MKVIYVAKRNADMTEGRGPMIPIAAFTNKRDADFAAKGQGVMGYGDGEVEEVMVFDSVAEWKQGEEDKLRASAMSKLSEAEIQALGLNKRKR